MSAAPTPGAAAGASAYEFTPGSGYVLPEYPFTEPPELAGGEMRRHPIVIVGAGITGLTMACCLARLGVDAVLLDEDNTVGVQGASSRGICYTQHSLEIFDRLGIYERISAKGVQWHVGRTFVGKEEVYSFDLRQQSNYGLSRQPALINIQQFYIEGYLVERIAALGHVDLRWKSRVTGFAQHAGHAVLTVHTPAGAYQLQAEHVIDASGAQSPFHAWCGATKTSRRGDDRWCMADVRLRNPLPLERRTWIEAAFNGNRCVSQQPMADKVWRFDYQLEPNDETANAEDAVRERLRRQFGAQIDYELVWLGHYAYRSQCLDHLRLGSVFFMGDSAKIVSPFGARGGNTGVADADNLACKLAAVLQGRAPASLLESYHEERHEAALKNVHVTNRTARFLRPVDGIERLFRQAATSLAGQHPFARLLINTGRMAVANSYTRSGVCEHTGGKSVQNVAFRWANGQAGNNGTKAGAQGFVNDLLDWARGDPLVLVFGDMSGEAGQRLRRLATLAPVRCVQVLGPDTRPRAREHIIDPQGHLQGACHVFGHAWALLRPDGYLAATGESVDTGLIQAVEHALGIKPSGSTT